MMNETGGDLRFSIFGGETFIPASQRKDGSWRKPRKVKSGYVPQDEMPKYESRGKQFAKLQSTYPIGLSPDLMLSDREKTRPIPGLTIDAQPSVSRKKRLKNPPPFPDSSKMPVVAVEKMNPVISIEDQLMKKVRNLQKKLLDIENLREKIDSGQLKLPEKTQLEKIGRKNQIEEEIGEIMRQIDSLSV